MTLEDAPMFMTTAQIAEATGLQVKAIQRLARERVLKPARGLRKPLKFYRPEVLAWARGEEPAPPAPRKPVEQFRPKKTRNLTYLCVNKQKKKEEPSGKASS